MIAFCAFVRKEIVELIRNKRLIILLAIFTMFAILGPLTAVLTPWILETMSDLLESSGVTVNGITITVLDSWTQYYKNLPILLIVFVLMFAGLFTKEYARGTFELIISKGMSRNKIYFAKMLTVLGTWTICYIAYFLISLAYNVSLWDNRVAQHWGIAAFLYWIFGVYVIIGMVSVSGFSASVSGVLIGTGVFAVMPELIGILPKITKYMPTQLTSGILILTGSIKPNDRIESIVVTAILCFVAGGIGAKGFSKKQL